MTTLQVPTGAHRSSATMTTAPLPRPASPILQPPPKPYSFLRHPRRFLKARLRMMFGQPLSVRWGLDRGMPAHRLYVAGFLREHCGDMHGRCLEFDDREYLDALAIGAVTHVDVLHIDDSNPRATVCADLTQPNDIPDAYYDCIVCTHVLQMIPDLVAGVRGMHRILKPGGVLLVAVPHVSMADDREFELWRFTRLGLDQLLKGVFGEGQVETRAFGNSLIAAGEMRGMVADEFTTSELNAHDPRSAVEICARAVKT